MKRAAKTNGKRRLAVELCTSYGKAYHICVYRFFDHTYLFAHISVVYIYIYTHI